MSSLVDDLPFPYDAQEGSQETLIDAQLCEPVHVNAQLLMTAALALPDKWQHMMNAELNAVLSDPSVTQNFGKIATSECNIYILRECYEAIVGAAARAQKDEPNKLARPTSSPKRVSRRSKRKRTLSFPGNESAADSKPQSKKANLQEIVRSNDTSQLESRATEYVDELERDMFIPIPMMYCSNADNGPGYNTWRVYLEVVNDNEVRLVYRDRGVFLQSYAIHTDQPADQRLLAAIILAHSHLPAPLRLPQGLPNIIPSQDSLKFLYRPPKATIAGTTLALQKDGKSIEVTLRDVISQDVMDPRGTCVCYATSPEWHGQTLVVKFAWDDNRRSSQDSLIRRIREKVEELGAEHQWVLRHVQNFLLVQTVCVPGDDTLERISVLLNENEELKDEVDRRGGYQKVELRVVVQEALFEMTSLPNQSAVASVFKDILKRTVFITCCQHRNSYLDSDQLAA